MRLAQLLDMSLVQRLADANYTANGMPFGIVDVSDGSVLAERGMQEICVKFHRAHPRSLQLCVESDRYIATRLSHATPCEYRCKNGLRDIAIPIVVAGETLAALILGQFFYEGEAPDREFFAQQARRYGYDEQAYLAALDRVPVFSRRVVDNIVEYDRALARFIADLAEGSLRHRKDQQAIRESEERFRVAFHTSPDSVNINRLEDGVFVAVNDGFTQMTGWSMGEVLGRSSLELQVWDDPADRARLVAGLKKDGYVRNLEARFRRKDGTILSGLMSARLIRLRGEQYLLSITRDVSDWKRAEEERDRLKSGLFHAAKMEAIGQLAGGVAHDFNNLLTVILSGAEELKHHLAKGSPLDPEVVEEIVSAGARARDLTRQLLAFARRQVFTPIPLDLNALILGAEKLLRRVLGEDIELVTNLQPVLWPVRCDPGQLEQVILNLAVNARDAMPNGGKLTIETSDQDITELQTSIYPGINPGPHVRLAVHDSGVGMAHDVKAHLFEPFFTTKPLGKGTGLGLATVHGIVKQSGGHIRVETEPSYGTTFEILFPRIMEAASAEQPAEEETRKAEARGGATVLLVEDDSHVRSATARALISGGYALLQASNGLQAVEMLAGHKGRLDLLVTDVMMPGVDGSKLAEAVRRAFPQVRVLFVSGHAHEVLGQRGMLDEGVDLLPKPYTSASLLERVRAALGRR